MNFLFDNCIFGNLDEDTLKVCNPFICGHDDLDDFFNNESHLYSKELLGKTYCFRLNEDQKVVICAFTVSNHSIKTKDIPNTTRNRLGRKIPYVKHSGNYPAVLIGRIGVSKDYSGKNIGGELMDFIKAWFISPQNKTGCRYIIVDAYNEEISLKYYRKNDFQFIFSTEEEEIECTQKDGEKLITRLMYFDLIRLRNDN